MVCNNAGHFFLEYDFKCFVAKIGINLHKIEALAKVVFLVKTCCIVFMNDIANCIN